MTDDEQMTKPPKLKPKPLRPASYQPTKAELEEDMSIDATPEDLAKVAFRPVTGQDYRQRRSGLIVTRVYNPPPHCLKPIFHHHVVDGIDSAVAEGGCDGLSRFLANVAIHLNTLSRMLVERKLSDRAMLHARVEQLLHEVWRGGQQPGNHCHLVNLRQDVELSLQDALYLTAWLNNILRQLTNS